MIEPRSEAILRYWFGAPNEEGSAAGRRELWFGRKEETDREIRRLFAADLEAAAAGRLDSWADSPPGRLALIVVCDQFPRNIHRGSPRAFATDPLALRLCLEGLDLGHDRTLLPVERAFFYLPLEHAEDVALQDRSVGCFEDLLRAVPDPDRESFTSYRDYAVAHRNVIARFGRFPHRNVVLGRQSTPEEIEFLRQPGSSFA